MAPIETINFAAESKLNLHVIVDYGDRLYF